MELRELDVWLAEHLFGYRWFIFRENQSDQFVTLEALTDDWVKRHEGRPCGKPVGGELDYGGPHYSTDSTAALMVLEKLASKTAVAIYQGETTGKWYVDVASENSNDPVFSEWAEALPLAICKAAKAYFEFHAKTQGQPE